MPLINCPNCGKPVSDSAEVCIHCGYEIGKAAGINKEDDKQYPAVTTLSKTEQRTLEDEFRSSDQRMDDMAVFLENCRLIFISSAISYITTIGGWIILIIIRIASPNFEIKTTTSNEGFMYAAVFALALSFLLMIALTIYSRILLHKRHPERKVIYNTEYDRWLKNNKSLRNGVLFDAKEKEIYIKLYGEKNNGFNEMS